MYCIKPPESLKSPLLSKNFAKTIIIALQGVQATVFVIGGSTKKSESVTVSISSIFFPLAVLGLLRLCAALWLTDDFVYDQFNEFGSDFEDGKKFLLRVRVFRFKSCQIHD